MNIYPVQSPLRPKANSGSLNATDAHIERLAAEKAKRTPCANSESEWRPAGRVLVDETMFHYLKDKHKSDEKVRQELADIANGIAAERDRLLDALKRFADPQDIKEWIRAEDIARIAQAALAGAEPQKTEG